MYNVAQIHVNANNNNFYYWLPFRDWISKKFSSAENACNTIITFFMKNVITEYQRLK
jgi:hypothetical protein